jgi:hypothetical protein
MKTENPQSVKLPVKDLARKAICDGHLFYQTGGRKFYLMKPGVYVDPEFVKKHAPQNPTFDFEPVILDGTKEEFKNLFRELRYLQFEKDLRLKCLEILKLFQKRFSEDEHFLAFALACHEEFCQISPADQLRMHETDMHLFRKALYSAAFAIIFGISNNFFHFLMLKDFYNLTFSLDIGLCDVNYSYFVAEACNAENRIPGSGVKYLKAEGASALETKVFLGHPEKTYAFLKSNPILSYPELVEVTLYQHELVDGTGFPRGVKKAQISTWEAIVILADALVEILPEYTFEKKVLEYVLSFQSTKLKDLPVNRAYKKLLAVMEQLKSPAQDTGS